MATATATRARGKKQARRAANTELPTRGKTWDPKHLPSATTLKAVDVSGGSNQYVNVSFEDGTVLRLYPIGIGRTKRIVAPARDVAVKWLRRELGIK